LTLKEGVVKIDFIRMMHPFVSKNEKPFDESFAIWVKAAKESPETAWSVSINDDNSGFGRSYSEWHNK
jgi:hypothetical protein